jgi:glycosyltransferase involved in cell wall biosynthesis
VIFFVGPLPPPVHGFSVINAAMLTRLQAVGEVTVFDRAPRPGHGALRRMLRSAGQWGAFLRRLWAAPRGSALYLGLSGGWGQLVDWPYLAAARLTGAPIVVHHHSFAYLRERSAAARSVLALLGRAQHLALSNAAFLPPARPRAERRETRRDGAALRLGFLSNISAEKGIWALLELTDALRARGVEVEALIAGPVQAAIADRFASEVAARPGCRHLGAVYGADKDAFFAKLDVLVFPTFYVNEAEPVTILEALAAAVPVVANARGCIADLVPHDAGVVFSDDAGFVALAAARLHGWAGEGAAAWQARRDAAAAAFAALQAEHARRLGDIVAGFARPGLSAATVS